MSATQVQHARHGWEDERTLDWNAVLRLVSDQARAIKGIVAASGEVEARVQRIEAWQMEQIAGGQGVVATGAAWSRAEIDAADDWQMALRCQPSEC
jgi:hypothetical protein